MNSYKNELMFISVNAFYNERERKQSVMEMFGGEKFTVEFPAKPRGSPRSWLWQERSMTMDKKIQFQKGADVLNEKGEEIGLLERVVLNPETRVVTGLVVRTGTFLGRKEKVVSMDMVVEATGHLVVLRDDKSALDKLPPFEEKQLVFDIETGRPRSSAQLPPVIYGYPGGAPLDLPKNAENLVTWTVQNIPEGTVAMKEGARVIADEGRHIGIVESVLADPVADQITHFRISSGLLSKETKLIPIQWVKTVGEDEVRLKVKKDLLEETDDIASLG